MEEKLKLSVPTNEGQNVVGEEELKTLGDGVMGSGGGSPMTSTGNYLFCFLIIYSFLSCKSVQRYEAPYQPNEIVVVGLGMNFNDYDENRRIWSEDWRKAMGEQRHVQVLEERIKKGKNIEENTNELQQYTDYLYKQQEARIIERMDFLREFYHDIFTLDKVVFIKKYKAHCSRDLLKRLKNINKKNT